MKFKSVNPAKIYIPFKDMEPGQRVIDGAKFIGRSPNKFGKENFDFERADGTIQVLNNCGSLEFIFKKIPVGSFVNVDYEGKDVLSKGNYKGKEFHVFSVEVGYEEGAPMESVQGEDSQEEGSEGEGQADMFGIMP